jgi:hypothetical protein
MSFAHTQGLLSALAGALWRAIRLPVVAVLLLIEPAINLVCGFAIFAGVVASVAFEFSAVGPRFPFWFVAGMSVSFAVVLVLYHLLLAFLVGEK